MSIFSSHSHVPPFSLLRALTIFPAAALTTAFLAFEERFAVRHAVASGGGPPGRHRRLLSIELDGAAVCRHGAGSGKHMLVDRDGQWRASAAGNGRDTERLQGRYCPRINVDAGTVRRGRLRSVLRGSRATDGHGCASSE